MSLVLIYIGFLSRLLLCLSHAMPVNCIGGLVGLGAGLHG